MADSDTGRGLARTTVGIAFLRLLLSGIPLLALIDLAAGWIGEPSAQGFSTNALLAILLVCVVAIAIYHFAVHLLERRRASELSFRDAVPWTVAGAFAGALIFCTVYAILWAVGVATFVGLRGFVGVSGAFGISLLAAVTEEVLFRGMLYRIVENTFGTLAALIVSGALFGWVHTANPSATLVSSAMIAVEAGLLLGLAYSATRSLWFPIGLHFAWNFTQGGIFGAAGFGFPVPEHSGISAVRAGTPDRWCVRSGGIGRYRRRLLRCFHRAGLADHTNRTMAFVDERSDEGAGMKLLCTNGIKAVAVDVLAQAGMPVDAVYASTNMLLKTIEGGEPGDVAVLSAEAIDRLITEGVLRQGSRVDIARSVIGVAVRAGAEAPDIGSADVLKAALRKAKAVAYSRTGISGLYMPTLFDKLGIAAEIAPKAVIPSSGTVGEAVARGDAEIGLQQVSELLPVPGVTVIGPLPDGVQLVTVFSAGTFVAASDPKAVRSLVERLTSDQARPLYTAKGLDPAF